MKSGIEKLTNSSHKMAEEMYKQSSAAQEQQTYSDSSSTKETAQETTDSQKDKKILDAEYKEEDGDNNK